MILPASHCILTFSTLPPAFSLYSQTLDYLSSHNMPWTLVLLWHFLSLGLFIVPQFFWHPKSQLSFNLAQMLTPLWGLSWHFTKKLIYPSYVQPYAYRYYCINSINNLFSIFHLWDEGYSLCVLFLILSHVHIIMLGT